MRAVLITLIASFVFTSAQAQKQRIWIDSDILIGKFRKDVDDGLAMLMAFNDTSLQIEGISFVNDVDYAEMVTTKLLSWYAPDLHIPTYKGAKDSTDFGRPNAATKAMTEALEKGPMTIVALGPITNVATVLKLRPDLHRNIEAITYCAGRRPGMLFNPGSGKIRFSDYNFDLDPWSNQILLDVDIPLTLAGYDCSDSLFVSKKDFIHLKKSKNKGDRWLFRQLKSWESLWRVFMGSEKGFIPFDCATFGTLFYPNEFEFEQQIPAYIVVDENDSKNQVSTPTKPYLLVDRTKDGTPITYCHYTKSMFKKRLLKALDHSDYQ
ncbi:MAG: nucleoside hydrolase [Flavobacteriales bacterium]|jgi:pyrimidine-specific ribonucleoside hydrolase|nr:nucleoside hydrolase [Flavobacteriales bacterium]